MSRSGAPGARDPWERLGWLMGVVWVAFLYFPLASAATADTSTVGRAVGVATVLAFGVAYLGGLLRSSRMDGDEAVRAGWTYLGWMVALQLASAVVLGVKAVYLLPFVISLATVVLPLRTALAVSAAGVAASVLVPLATGDLRDMGFFVAVVVLVAVFTMVIRVVNGRQLDHRALAEALAIVEERERVARDVHDVLGHSLTVVTVKAELAERLIAVDPDRARAELAEIRSLTREALGEIRATVSGLRVARLADEVAAARSALTGAGIAADLPEDIDMVRPRDRIVLAWVLREAVTNVVRHSGATRCTVELGSHLLRVTDDGGGPRGLSEAGGRGGEPVEGNGLRGARERVSAAGGTLVIHPGADGRGTTVEVRL